MTNEKTTKTLDKLIEKILWAVVIVISTIAIIFPTVLIIKLLNIPSFSKSGYTFSPSEQIKNIASWEVQSYEMNLKKNKTGLPNTVENRQHLAQLAIQKLKKEGYFEEQTLFSKSFHIAEDESRRIHSIRALKNPHLQVWFYFESPIDGQAITRARLIPIDFAIK